MAEIAAASEEQAAGIDQVSNAVTQMDEATQQNAALVEQAAAASKTMQMNAQQLVSEISFLTPRRTWRTSIAGSTDIGGGSATHNPLTDSTFKS